MSPWAGIIISTQTPEQVTAYQRHRTGDEPTSALDPEMINEVLEVITNPAKEGLR